MNETRSNFSRSASGRVVRGRRERRRTRSLCRAVPVLARRLARCVRTVATLRPRFVAASPTLNPHSRSAARIASDGVRSNASARMAGSGVAWASGSAIWTTTDVVGVQCFSKQAQHDWPIGGRDHQIVDCGEKMVVAVFIDHQPVVGWVIWRFYPCRARSPRSGSLWKASF